MLVGALDDVPPLSPLPGVSDEGLGYICTIEELSNPNLLAHSQHHLIQNRPPSDSYFPCGSTAAAPGRELRPPAESACEGRRVVLGGILSLAVLE
jgi:hypothetical protein